jgi:hypothetical protein
MRVRARAASSMSRSRVSTRRSESRPRARWAAIQSRRRRQRAEGRPQRGAVGHVGEGLHLRVNRVGRSLAHHGAHLGARATRPCGPPPRAPVVAEGLRRDAVPHGPLHLIAVLQVGDAVVEVVGGLVAAVGTRHEAAGVAQLQGDLKDEGHVGLAGFGDGFTVVDHEERQGAGARREARRVGSDETALRARAHRCRECPRPLRARRRRGRRAHRATPQALPLLRAVVCARRGSRRPCRGRYSA